MKSEWHKPPVYSYKHIRNIFSTSSGVRVVKPSSLPLEPHDFFATRAKFLSSIPRSERRLLRPNVSKNSFSKALIEKYDSYTRAGEVIDLEGVQYVIESTDHRLVDGWHYDKLGLRKIV